MQKNVIYSAAFVAISIFLLLVIFDSETEESGLSFQDEEEQYTQTITNKDNKIKQSISIEYKKSPQKQQQQKIIRQKGEDKENYDYDDYAKLADSISSEQKKYNVSTSTTKVGKFTFKIASSSKIAKVNPEAFPMLPAFIRGKIDGVPYSVVVPVDLQNKDLVLKIENSETGEMKDLPFPINQLKSGANVDIDIDYYNIDNYHIKKENSIIGPPAPPIKAPPVLPGQT